MRKAILILGLGKSGKAACELAISKEIQLVAIDEKKTPDLVEFASGMEGSTSRFFLGGDFPGRAKADLIVTSPGIPRNSRLAKFAEELKIPVVSELQFGASFAEKPILAVGGTNGKTTTTELCAHILNSLGIRASAAGNTGFPLSEAVIRESSYDVHVVEVSSFQLERSPGFRPSAAALLNISPDHMDRYSGFDEYEEVKFSLFKNIGPRRSVINASLLDPYRRHCGGGKPFVFSNRRLPGADAFPEDAAIHLKRTGRAFRAPIPEGLPGRHNAENISAALLLVKLFLGAKFRTMESKITDAISSFRLGRHRLELVLERDGIKYVNDSKATNPDSVLAALDLFGGEGNVRLILGGLDKDMDFSPILTRRRHIKKAYITGQCKEKLFNLLKKRIACALLRNFTDAVLSACEEAERGDVVLMSPACASMDEFRNYQERGEKFVEIINRRFSK